MEEYLKTMLGKIDTSLIAKITKIHSIKIIIISN